MSAESTDGQQRMMAKALRRETHSSRSVLSGVAAAVIILLAIYGLLESALRAVGQPPWLNDPQTAVDKMAHLPAGTEPVLLGLVGVVLFLIGLLFFLNAVLPGKRARHTLLDQRVHTVVDDEVIAAALARRARLSAGVTRDQVMVVVGQRLVTVNVRPTSGMAVSAERIAQAVEAELTKMAPSPMPTVTVNVSHSGVIGV
ncbi:MAG: hypothetical protein HIU81_00250 [Acidobacteria bacterium]|nr:hypothetical protein [Acidobacteriota bacterium]